MIKRFCAICGQEIDSFVNYRAFNIKEYTWFGECGGREKIDAHDTCVKKLQLIAAIRDRKDKNERASV